jgi:hypothetical protein
MSSQRRSPIRKKHLSLTPSSRRRQSRYRFEVIFKNSPIELANEELRLWRESYLHIDSLLKNKNNLSEMTKVIQQELIKGEKADEQIPRYMHFQMGLFYSCITCSDKKIGDVIFGFFNVLVHELGAVGKPRSLRVLFGEVERGKEIGLLVV